jgi:hypothetical protein
MTNRLQLLSSVDPYTGNYFSQAWIQRNVLRLSDDEIKMMQKEIDKEKKEGKGIPTDILNQLSTNSDQETASSNNTKEETITSINKLIMETKNDR